MGQLQKIILINELLGSNRSCLDKENTVKSRFRKIKIKEI